MEALLSLPEQPFLRRLDTLAHSWISAFRWRRSGRDAMRAQIVGRARYAEDALLAQNPSQYLVLAAGLDTFALRHATERMQGFEIDHPATQAWKWARIKAPPKNLRLIPVDFERTTLADSEFDPEPSTFVSWLGTTKYLTGDTIAETLRGVGEQTAGGTRLVLDYWSEAPSADGRATTLLASTRLATAFEREPIAVRAFGHGSARPRDALACAGAPRSCYSECALFGAPQRRPLRAELRLPHSIGTVIFAWTRGGLWTAFPSITVEPPVGAGLPQMPQRSTGRRTPFAGKLR